MIRGVISVKSVIRWSFESLILAFGISPSWFLVLTYRHLVDGRNRLPFLTSFTIGFFFHFIWRILLILFRYQMSSGRRMTVCDTEFRACYRFCIFNLWKFSNLKPLHVSIASNNRKSDLIDVNVACWYHQHRYQPILHYHFHHFISYLQLKWFP